jgi:hypothetical protein
MFVITVDQVDSRSTPDAVASQLGTLNASLGERLLLPPERTAGDEFQLLLGDADATLGAVLELTRSGLWSVGCGVGSVREPLPTSIREAAGEAFLGARDAVDRAKKRPSRFALAATAAPDQAGRLEALIDLLLVTRARRSAEGWELHDLLTAGLTQAAAAARLGITPQAASLRAQAADLKTEAAVTGALATLLAQLDEEAG